MVLIQDKRAKFPTLTVAWAAPDFHRRSFDNLSIQIRHEFYKISVIREIRGQFLINVRHSHLPACRIRIQQHLHVVNFSQVRVGQNFFRRAERKHFSAEEQHHPISKLGRKVKIVRDHDR